MRSHSVVPSRSRNGRLAARLLALATALLALGSLANSCNNGHEPVGQQTFTSPQATPILLSDDGSLLFVANTTSRTVSVIDTSDNSLVREVEVGLEPVGLALRPDGSELWVSNHVSDSVSVVDLDDQNDTYLYVIETIQEFDANGATLFDEPVGIAFASNSKAYVALSSRNDIAIVDANSYTVTGRIHITAQEPRALFVRGGHLYVAAFESFNQTELSICPESGPGNQCTLDLNDLVDFVVSSPNIPGSDARIVLDPDVPDRDLFVIDTSSDTIVDEVSGVGTLLYNVVVSSAGEVYIAQTDARNDVNPQDGDNLVELDNRMFLNQIGRVSCPGGSCGSPSVIDLEPLPPSQPAAGDQLATPYGLALSGDDATLVATAAGTSRVFTMNASTGAILDILDLNDGVGADFGQQIPKGVALRSDGGGAAQTAYVLNTLENTVSVVDVSTPSAITHVAKIPVGSDPTPDDVRRGRIAFNNAFASSSGTFSCESCHPDSNTDQLLWRIGGACFFGDCSENDEIRSTMPVRGLRNTLPLHWDGTLGDPFGGPNGAVGNGGNGGTDCTLGDADGDHDCFVDLVLASLSGVMCDQTGACPPGGNELSAQEQDDMARFLAQVQYPPARGRPIDDVVTTEGVQGFSDFFNDRGGLGSAVGVRSCADMDSGCHALPLGADTNSTTLGGFDAPTMRGMLDRTLQFSIGITNAEETLVWAKDAHTIFIPGIPLPLNAPASVIPYDPAEGPEEDVTFAAAFAVFQPVYGQGPLAMLEMFEQADTGFGGAVGRQVTLNLATTTGGALADTEDILAALESSDARGFSNLRGVGVRDTGSGGKSLVVSYRAGPDVYRNTSASVSLTRAQLIAEAQAGTLEMTFTANLPRNHGHDDFRQPLLSVTSIADGPFGNPDLPVEAPGAIVVDLAGIDVRSDAQIVVDGQVHSGSISCTGGSFTPYCDSGTIELTIDSLTTEGLHLLQVQNPSGPLSVELPLCVTSGPISVCKVIN
ncbi:MAG: YncE family protein [Myxococcota bacterium]